MWSIIIERWNNNKHGHFMALSLSWNEIVLFFRKHYLWTRWIVQNSFWYFCNIGWRFVYFMYALYESQISLSIRIRLKIETSNITIYIRSSLLMCIKNPKLLVEYQMSCCCTVFVMESNQKKEGHTSNVSFQVEFKTLKTSHRLHLILVPIHSFINHTQALSIIKWLH